MEYVRPDISCLIKNPWIAWAQTGSFFITFTNEQNGCCGDGDCGPPNNVPIPALIDVNNGTITITVGNSSSSCTFQGTIDENGSFFMAVDLQYIDQNCGFDDGRCSDMGPEPNQCCGRIGQEIITGTYQNGHLQGSYANHEDVDENDPDCSMVTDDCAETSDFTGDFS